MKYLFTFFLSTLFIISFGQNIQKIKIPKGVTYNYCDTKTNEKAVKLINESLADSTDYSLLQNILIVGPNLWSRYNEIEQLNEIEGGNTIFLVDDKKLKGKMTQRIDDTKKVWDEFRKEINGEYIIRKATEEELIYYWSVISFDIEEPLLIVETNEHSYILNILKKDMKLMWLDESPKTKGYKAYENGEEVTITKGEKETKLERVVLLTDDETIRKNITVEDLVYITKKCTQIFDTIFKNSPKEGKVLLEFELTKKQNNIAFAVKDDVDLELMAEFEKQINAEIFPNSKKKPIKFQLLFKINSYNETK